VVAAQGAGVAAQCGKTCRQCRPQPAQSPGSAFQHSRGRLPRDHQDEDCDDEFP
jgi:hypothetical protein